MVACTQKGGTRCGQVRANERELAPATVGWVSDGATRDVKARVRAKGEYLVVRGRRHEGKELARVGKTG